MKAHYISLFFALILGAVIVLPSCEPEIVTTLKLPKEDPRLVITAILEPGNGVHSVFLTRSVPYGQSTVTGHEVVNGLITISDGTGTVSLVHFEGAEYRFYDSDLPVVPGNTYTITAEAPGFDKKIFGTCTVPEAFQPEAELVSLTFQTGIYESVWMVSMRFKSVLDGEAFYRITGKVYAIPYLNGDADSTLRMDIYSTGKTKELLRVEGGSTQWHDLRFQMWDHLTGLHYDSIVPIEAEFSIYRTDEPYYRFHYPFIVNGYWGNEGGSFGEPTIIYTNITNGYGVMAGINKRTLNMPLR